jgi:hypothetical protein
MKRETVDTTAEEGREGGSLKVISSEAKRRS